MTGIEQFRCDNKRALVVGGATGMGPLQPSWPQNSAPRSS